MANRKRIHVSSVFLVIPWMSLILLNCGNQPAPGARKPSTAFKVVTEQVQDDSDDPAFWLHPTDRSKSLIFGTDKGDPGALYVFGLDGRIIPGKVIRNLKRPNNVDVEYGLRLNKRFTDIAVTTQKRVNRIRVHSVPDMRELDGGGLEVFAGVPNAQPMGIGLYKRPADGAIFAIVSRKRGPEDGTYLWQYRLEDNGAGGVTATKVREFGLWSGKGEIEAIAVDDTLGFVYYSDESCCIRKYHADPDVSQANMELAQFGMTGFKRDREGISIYQVNDGTGYIIVSDQQANTFNVYKREGEPNNPHTHPLVTVLKLNTRGSDGSELTNAVLNDQFPSGLFIAMSTDKTFQLYSWQDLAGDALMVAPDGNPTLAPHADAPRPK